MKTESRADVLAIESIDHSALALAQDVAAAPGLRATLREQAETLRAALLAASSRLTLADAGAAAAVGAMVSESLLDLSFVLRPSGPVSLRLAQTLRAQR